MQNLTKMLSSNISCHQTFSGVVESTRYKNSLYTVCTALRAPTLRRAMLREMRKSIRHECQALCLKGGQVSVLKRSSIKDASKFKWADLSRELHRRAPILFLALKAACARKIQKKMHTWKRVLPMAAAILLRGWNQFCNLTKTVISLVLYNRHCSKMVLRLIYVYMC